MLLELGNYKLNIVHEIWSFVVDAINKVFHILRETSTCNQYIRSIEVIVTLSTKEHFRKVIVTPGGALIVINGDADISSYTITCTKFMPSEHKSNAER